MQNKATVIKQGLKKRAAFSYQQPTTHTLTNLNKKIKTDSFLVTQSQPISQSSTQLEPKQEIIIDDTASTRSVGGRYDCNICKKPFTTSASLYQHKKSRIHLDNV